MRFPALEEFEALDTVARELAQMDRRTRALIALCYCQSEGLTKTEKALATPKITVAEIRAVNDFVGSVYERFGADFADSNLREALSLANQMNIAEHAARDQEKYGWTRD